MKKLLCFALTFLLMLSLLACGSKTEEPSETTQPLTTASSETAGLQVGFGRQKVMPDGNLTLGGSGTVDRVSEGVLDFLTVSCIAVTDELENTVLMFTVDTVQPRGEWAEKLPGQVSEATGVPVENITISATHTHSAPAMYNLSLPGMPAYVEVFKKGAIQAAKDALADRASAEIFAGSAEAEGLAFSRHYIMPDGSVKKTPGKSALPTAHADEPNDTVQIVKFDRGEEKKPVIMMTFGIHPTFNGKATDKMISADFPGPTRDYIEAETGAHVAYFTSSAGNQSGDSQVADLSHGMDYKTFGKALGKVVVDALPGLTALEAGSIKLNAQLYPATTNKDKMDQLTEAKHVSTEYNKLGEDAVKPLLEQYGFDSVWEAIAIVNRSELGDTWDVDMRAMAIGELSMIFAPYEMFGPSAETLMAQTPYDMTLVITCSNGSLGYIPTDKAFDYDVYEDLVTKFTRGTAETLIEEYVQMLKTLKAS